MQEELIQKFRDGNKQAGDDYYKANIGLVYKIARQNRGLLKDEEETLAIVNQAFAYSINRVDLEKGMFSTYFAKVARGMVLRHYRDCERTIRTQRRDCDSKLVVHCASLDEVIYASDTEDITIGHIISSNDDCTDLFVEEALNKVNAKDRKAFKLKFLHDMSQAAIGKMLGCGQVEISRRLARATATLKITLKNVY